MVIPEPAGLLKASRLPSFDLTYLLLNFLKFTKLAHMPQLYPLRLPSFSDKRFSKLLKAINHPHPFPIRLNPRHENISSNHISTYTINTIAILMKGLWKVAKATPDNIWRIT